MIPQIDNSFEINTITKTLPSKTYKLNNDILTTQKILKQPIEVSGKEIIVNDVAINEGSLNIISGKTEQATRSGINQLMSFKEGDTSYFYSIANTINSNTDYYKAEPLADNWIHTECDVTSATAQYYINTFIAPDKLPNLKTSTNYTVVIEFRNVNITKMSGTLNLLKTHTTNVDNYFKNAWNLSSANFKDGAMYKKLVITFDTFSGSIALRNFHTINPGDKFSYDYRLSILEGDYTNISYTYEPFGVMPSPDYPSEIRNVGNNINLFINELQNKTLNGINVQINTDGSMTFNGTATANTFFHFTDDYKLNLLKGDYTASCNWNGSIVGTMYMNVNTGSEALTYFELLKQKNKTFSITENKLCRGYFYIYKDTVLKNLIVYPKLEQGSVATPYTPYNCGSLDFKIQNKNEFDINSSDILISSGSSRTINDNVLKISGWSVGYRFKLKKNTTYYIKAKRNVISGDGGQIRFTNATFTQILKNLDKNNGYFNTGDNEEIGIQFCSGFTAVGTCEFSEIILSKTDIDYVEHKGQIVSFPLTKGQILHSRDYLADDGIHQVEQTCIFNGTENIFEYRKGEWTNDYIAVFIKYSAKYSIMKSNDSLDKCTHLTRKPSITGGLSINALNGFSLLNTGYLYMCISTSVATSAATFKSWLQEQYANGTPLTVEGRLEKEIVIPYTEAQKEIYNKMQNLQLYYNTTIISTLNEIKPTLKLTYYPYSSIDYKVSQVDRIIGYTDNLEAIRQAIYHILSVERYTYLIYDDNYGVELEQYIGKDLDYIKATIEETLREALTYDLRILDVSVTEINQVSSDVVKINFNVYTIYGNLIMEVNINV